MFVVHLEAASYVFPYRTNGITWEMAYNLPLPSKSDLRVVFPKQPLPFSCNWISVVHNETAVKPESSERASVSSHKENCWLEKHGQVVSPLMQFPTASGKTHSKELLIKLPIRENLIVVFALPVKCDVIFLGPLNVCSSCFGARTSMSWSNIFFNP